MTKTLADADRQAKKIVESWTTGAALTGWIPGSTFFLTAADTAMMNQVANAYDVSSFDMEHLTSTLAGVITSAIAGGLITEVVGLIPVIGWAIKSAAMATKAKLIGTEVTKYFRIRSPLPDSSIKVDIEE